LKRDEAILYAQHKAANEWYDYILYSRLNDPHLARSAVEHVAGNP
jgi:hypothetical protein